MSAGTVVFVEEVPGGSELVFEYPRVANLITDPAAEVTGLGGWAAAGTGVVLARDTAVFDSGAASFRIDVPDPGASSDRAEDQVTLVEGETYHAWARIRTTAGRTARLWVVDGGSTNIGQTNMTGDGTFQDVLLPSFIAGASNPHRIRVGRIAAGSPAYSIYFDRVVVARGPFRGYVDGSMPGYTWAAGASASETLETLGLYVADPTDFQPEGGELLVAGTEEKGYSAVNDDTGLVTLDSALVGTFAEGDRVDTLPLAIERFAHVQLEDQDEVLIARVPHALYDRLPVGARDENVDDAELAELGRDPGGELVVADVLNREPLIDAGFLDPATTPDIPTSDGLAPSSSPTPIVRGGVGSLFVTWTPIANHDLVVYEVHISTSSGFTPTTLTYAGETPGSFFLIEKLPGTTNRPAYGTTYFVRLVAKDEDGAGVVGTQASGSPVQVTGPDLIAGAVTAGKIAANAVTAGTLESILALTSALLAGTPGAQRLEIGYGTEGGVLDPSFIGIRAFSVDGLTQTFRVDAITGEVYVKGRIDFGSTLPDGSGASRLLGNDVLELAQQTASSFQTPTRVQSASGSTSGSSSGPVTWPQATQAGSLLLMTVLTRAANATPPTVNTPAGWTLVTSVSGQDPTSLDFLRLTVFKIENSASRSGFQNVTFSALSSGSITHIFEYSGVDIQDVAAGPVDVEATNSGKSTTVSTGTPPTPTQASELWFASIATNVNVAGGSSDTLTAPTNGYSQARTSRDGSVLMRLTEYDRSVTAIASPAMSATAAYSAPFLGVVVAFKAKTAPSNLGADRADVVRFWTRDVGGNAYPHVTLEDGTAAAIALAKAGERTILERVTATHNLASRNGHGGGTESMTVTGVKVGDEVVAMSGFGAARQFIFTPEPIVTVANQVQVDVFNADTVTIDPASQTFHFWIVRKS